MLKDLQRFATSIWADPSNRGQRIRRVIRAGTWQVWKRLANRPVNATLFNGTRLRVYPDCQVSPGALYFRIPNSKPIEFMHRHITGGTLVDVGANVGLVSLLLADKVNQAWLFEPNPRAAARAQENLRLNRLAFEVHQIALSDRNGTVELEDRGGVSATNRTVAGFKPSGPTIQVQSLTFDDVIGARNQLPAAPWFVKIDVEGHENSVLRGMQQFLAHQRPRLVMFEYLQRTNLEETFRIFDSVEYRVMVLEEDGQPAWAELSVAPLQDLFACPKEIGDQFVRGKP